MKKYNVWAVFIPSIFYSKILFEKSKMILYYRKYTMNGVAV